MMKIIFAAAILSLLFSCGRIDQPGSSVLGNSRSAVTETLNESDVTRLQKVCNSLSAKQNAISGTTTNTFNFSVANKTCESESFSPDSVVQVNIESAGSDYKFRRTDNNAYFIFPDVETATTGSMVTVCSALNSRTVPVISEGMAIWFSSARIEDCRPGADEACVMIEKGILKDGSYKIESKEWLTFQIDENRPNYGFYTKRRLQSSTACGEGKYSETRVSLK